MSATPRSAPLALDLTSHRGCYTCASSPPTPRPGCDQLTGDEALDGPLLDYCEASGVNDEASPTRGFPTDLSVACPRWRARTT